MNESTFAKAAAGPSPSSYPRVHQQEFSISPSKRKFPSLGIQRSLNFTFFFFSQAYKIL